MSSLALIDDINPDYEPLALAETGPTAIQLLLDLEKAGLAKPRSLTLPPDLPTSQAIALGGFLGELKTRGNFYVGDWLIQCEQMYPEEFSQIAEATGLSESTRLRVMAVCLAITEARRRDNLTWSTHALVYKLGAREQNAWLGKASRLNWTYSELKKALTADRQEQAPQLPGTEDVEPDTDLLIEAARSLVRNAELAGDNVICRIEDFKRVEAALGEEA